jgi:hypothetical protein
MIPFEDKIRSLRKRGFLEKGEVMKIETEIRDGRVSLVRLPNLTRRQRGKTFGTRSSTAWLDSGVALLMETDDGNGL